MTSFMQATGGRTLRTRSSIAIRVEFCTLPRLSLSTTHSRAPSPLSRRTPLQPAIWRTQYRTFVATRPQYKKDPTTSLPANPQTHYDFFPTTLPKGYPPAGDFSIDLRSLKQEFLQLQAQAHPDLHPPELKSKAEALSSRINEAYKTLQDPLRRAQYILSLNGHGDIEANLEGVGMFGSEEGADNELLMVVMEAREAIEEANSEEDLETIREDNQERIEDSKTILEAAMDKEDWEAVKAECVKLRYWMNIKQTVAEWEAGKGVPNLQH